MAKFDTLFDTFGGPLDTIKWATWGTPAPVTSGGTLQITSTHAWTGVNTRNEFDLANSNVQVETETALPNGTGNIGAGSHEFAVNLYNATQSFQIQFFKSAAALLFRYTIDNGSTWNPVTTNGTYSISLHRFMRFRNTSGTAVILETSGDGVTWSSAAGRGGTVDPGQTITALTLELSAGYWDVESAADWTIAQVGNAPILFPPILTSLTSINDLDETTLKGTVNPNTLPTQYWFEYGQTQSYGRTSMKLNAGKTTAVNAQVVLGAPTVYDELVAKQRDRLHWFVAWLGLNGAEPGFIGEIGWPGTSGFTWGAPVKADLRYNAVGRYMLDRYQEMDFYVTPWAAGDDWGDYGLLTHGRVVANSLVSGVANTVFEPGKVIEDVSASFGTKMGVNLAGAEFAFPDEAPTSTFTNTNVGTYGTNYLYPSLGTMQFVAAHGVKVIRLPIRWERIQRTLNGALDTTEAGRLDTAIANAATAGVKVIVDIHNYAGYYTSAGRQNLGTAGLTQANFVDLWTKLSTRYKANAAVLGYDLMNEPIQCGESVWEAASQAAVNAIRANGDTKIIFAEIYDWGQIDAFSWGGQADGPWITGATGIVYSAHHYLEAGANYDITYDANLTLAKNEGYSRFTEGLPPNTTYHWRLAAQNAHGTTYSTDQVSIAGAPPTPGVTPTPGEGGEVFVLDPIEVSSERVQVDLTPYVGQAGPDFGDAQIEQYLADAQQGQIAIDYRIPNRVITVPLLLRDLEDGTTFEQARARIQQKVSLFQREGGTIKRETQIGPLYADVIGATLKFGGGTYQATVGLDPDATLTLTCIPDFYGEEHTSQLHISAAGTSELMFPIDVVGDVIAGNYPARARVIVNELDSKLIRGLLWGVRSRNFSSDVTASLGLKAKDMTALAPAVSDGTVISHSSVSNQWTAIMSTDMTASGSLTHVGAYRVWARVKASSEQYVRLLWDVGDMVFPATNAAARITITSGGTDFYSIVDLGEVRLDAAPVGAHRWAGVIQAKTVGASGSIAIDRLWFQPLDEFSGRVTATPNPTVGLVGYNARDEFNQTAGNLTGKSLPQGGTWTRADVANFSNTDFTMDLYQPNPRVIRSSISDTGPRAVYASGVGAGGNLSSLVAQIDFYHSTPLDGTQEATLLFRYVDGSNYGFAKVFNATGGFAVELGYVVSAVPNTLASVYVPSYQNAWWTLKAMALDTGQIFTWLYRQDSPVATPVASRSDTAATNIFGPGHTLAIGKSGFADMSNSSSALTRYYDNFAVWVPDNDAVLFPGKTAELRFDGMQRERRDGSYYAPISNVIGDLPRLPPTGMETRTVEFFLKPSEGDFDNLPDPSYSRINAQIKFRPSYLFVPESEA